jgi:DNA uptake protein ComE-like DNA-binding protein
MLLVSARVRVRPRDGLATAPISRSVEGDMTTKIRINLANTQELSELPGLSAEEVQAIVRHRALHGPIKDAKHLAEVLGNSPAAEAVAPRADFTPADTTAPEAPGA